MRSVIGRDEDDGNRVRRVGRHRLVRAGHEHLLGVAVVGRDDHRSAGRQRGVDDPAKLGSTASVAVTAALMTPVWPTMSQLAKLTITKA